MFASRQRGLPLPRILLIEDDIDVRTVVEHILYDAEYQVDTTENVAGGKELLACRDYDLVLSDGRLPDGLGMEIVDQAQEKGIPALIFTGYAFNLRAGDHIDLSAYNILLKPMHPTELLAAIKAALDA